ncbi:unnamed protein product [Discula destructiva]
MPAHTKNIVITGAARGIGRVIARHLALLGHNIFLLDIQEAELVYTATAHIPQILRETPPSPSEAADTASAPPTPPHQEGGAGGLVGYHVCDLRDPAAITAAIHAAAAFFPGGEIDVLVNNAGLCKAQFKRGRTMEDPTVLDEWAAYLAVNLTAPFLVSQACIPFMKPKPGPFEKAPTMLQHPFDAVIRPEAARAASGFLPEPLRRRFAHPGLQSRCIINVSSFRALQSEPNCEGYAASKAGALGLTQAMAISGAQWGIRCNAILPGFTFVDHECREGDESEGKMWWTEGIAVERHRHHPAGRIGYGEDVADAVVWLMGAGFVTGQEICIDGGISKVKHASA